ncbi:MAG: YwiC-like family protein [Chloroflexi bacterium]|nr:YwiC-like family protein [Chloroflexota bacterium]
MVSALFRRHVALPQDHGTWVLMLSPLLIGLFTGERLTRASVYLVIGMLAAFLIRQPVTLAIKAYAGRRAKTDLPAAHFWILLYGLVILAALGGLIADGFAYVLYLTIPGVIVFGWHLYLVTKRAERRQVGVEVVASGVLALAAPAAFWTGEGVYDPIGWALWLLVWLQSAASIVHAYLRLEQRDQVEVPPRDEQWKMARRALLYTSFNLTSVAMLSFFALLPRFLALPYLLQWAETLWGTTHPAIGFKPTKIGMRQLIISALFTLLFIATWRI